MRKKTVNHIAMSIVWYVIYFLPLVCYLAFIFIQPGSLSNISPVSFVNFCNDIGFSVITDNIIYNTLYAIFGVNGIIPFIEYSGIYIILSWFVATFLMHILIDLLLFIPRWAHDFMSKKDNGDI